MKRCVFALILKKQSLLLIPDTKVVTKVYLKSHFAARREPFTHKNRFERFLC